jgi:hypothetical protein
MADPAGVGNGIKNPFPSPERLRLQASLTDT